MKWIRYPDLVAKGVVNSRMTLKRLIDTRGFPPGVLITPNARAWDERDVDAWIAARPAARKPSTRKPKSQADGHCHIQPVKALTPPFVSWLTHWIRSIRFVRRGK
jgi:predicted DNA-binding transcriptional regulator AlpA